MLKAKLIPLLLILLGFGGITGPAQGQSELSETDLIKTLRQGGYSIYFRHERTNWTLSDDYMGTDQRFSCDPAKMRQLSEEGRERARNTGNAMRQAGIPVNEVLSSPYCRCVETAELLNVGPVTTTEAVMNLRVAQYYGGRQAIINSAQALLSKPTKAGFNRVIVAHGNVAQAATPVYPGEGEAVVFKATGDGKFMVVGRMPASDWPH